MGRTIPSFRLALAEEQAQWSEFRKHLTKKEKQTFDEMFATVGLYISACSMAAKPDRFCVIIASILLHHYIDLVEITKTLDYSQQSQTAAAVIEGEIMH